MSSKKTLPYTLFGSMGEIMRISLPIILSILSGALMTLADRKCLAHFSTEAMSAAVTASMPIWNLQVAALSLASIAGIFVGQYNGADQKIKVAQPAWQMIWFSLALIPFFFLATYFGEQTLFNHSSVRKEALLYFRWMMPWGWLTPLIGAFSSFFIGRRESFPILIASGLGNGLNIALNIPLIFGWGVVPQMGIEGAAIATIFGQVIQCLILLLFFLSPSNRENFKTHHPSLDFSLFWNCFKLGSPLALDKLMHAAAWNFFFLLIATIGKVPLSVITITQSMLLFFTFVSQGIGKAVSSVTANLVGEKKWDQISLIVRGGILIHFGLFLCYSFFFVVFAQQFITLFLPASVATEGREEILQQCLYASIFIWCAVLIDGIRWVYIGLLTAVGDTKFLMWVGSLSVWLLAILPIAFLIRFFDMPVIYSWVLSSVYYGIVTLLYAWRFKQQKWMGRLIISEEKNSPQTEGSWA